MQCQDYTRRIEYSFNSKSAYEKKSRFCPYRPFGAGGGSLFFSLSLRSIWQGYYLSCIYYYYFGNRWVDIVVPVWVN